MKKFLVQIFLFATSIINAQENAGILHSNYSPTNTVFINPSTLADSKAFLDIHVVGASIFANTNMLYLPGKNFKLINSISGSESAPNPLLNKNGKLKSGIVDVAIQGPSAAIVLGKNSFGLFTNSRFATDMRNVPDHLANYIINGFGYVPQHGFEFSGKDIKINTMAWGELGFTYARILKASGTNMFNGGITIKRLFGITAASFLLDDVSYNVIDDKDLEIVNLSGAYAYALPAFGAGKGWGFDLGFTYKKTKENLDGYVPHSPQNGCKESNYIYKLGVSLIDFGQIKFATGATQQSLTNASGYIENYSGSNTDGAEAIDSTLSNEFSPGTISSKNSFVSKLPSAVSLQFDYNVYKNFFAATAFTKGLPHRQFGVQRADVLSLTPRFEIKRFEVALPLSMYEYEDFYAGLAFRFNSIIIGTDRIGPYIFRPDLNGIDFYIALKYTIFKRMACNDKKLKARGGQKKGIVPCASWN
jgi:Family of unknown function (DUF5723)